MIMCLMLFTAHIYNRVDEIKRMMEEFGDVRDVYIPQDYHTRRPRYITAVTSYTMTESVLLSVVLTHLIRDIGD